MTRLSASSFVKLGMVPLLLFVLGCSAPRVIPSPALDAKVLRTIAVLPPQSSAAVTRERRAKLRSAFQNELTNQGFFVLDDAVVDSMCRDSACSDRGHLGATYPIDAFALLVIDSASRNNFLAGYYNAIVGRLVLSDVEGTQLLEVRHTERERGGLLFNSGQIFQGLISQIRNADDADFATLATKFAQSIVSSIPRGTASAMPAAVEPPTIAEKSIIAESAGVYRVCATGSPGALAALVLENSIRTNLREVSPGAYCGKYLIVSPEQFTGAMLELRDALGLSSRTPLGALPLASANSCAGPVTVEKKGATTVFVSPCPAITRRLLVYSAPTSGGPFSKIAEVHGASWDDRKQRLAGTETLAFVAIPENGVGSEPTIYPPVDKEGA